MKKNMNVYNKMQDMSYVATLSNEDLYKIVYTPWKQQLNDVSWYYAVNELCNRDIHFRENYTHKSTKNNNNEDVEKMMFKLQISSKM